MNLQMLQYFITIANEQSISRAAGKLFVSQPALSKQVRKFEALLGFTVFIRTVHGMELTEKGRRLYRDVKPLVHQLQHELQRHMAQNVIRFGSEPFVVSYYFPDYMRKLEPFKVQITAVRDDALDLIRLLENDEIDAAIIQDYPDQEGLSSCFLFEDKFYVTVPVDHPLAEKQEVKMEDCLQYTQLLPPERSPLYEQMASIISRLDIHPPELIELPYHALIGYVAQGAGISYLPAIMADKIAYRGVVFLPLKEHLLHRKMYLYAGKDSILHTLQAILEKS